MNTLENNKLIEEFMDWKVRKFTPSDWNDIIEVIYKITKLGVSYDDKGNEIFLKIGDSLLMLKIETTYNSVLNLIKWYNLQNS